MSGIWASALEVVTMTIMMVLCACTGICTSDAFLQPSPLYKINQPSLQASSPIFSTISFISSSNKSILKSAQNENESSSSIPSEFQLPESTLTESEQEEIQWDLFQKHHARGKWRGTWTSYNYMGDVIDDTIGSVNLRLDPNDSNHGTSSQDEDEQQVIHTHEVAMGITTSNCATCFDSTSLKTIPISTYTKSNLSSKKWRAASIGLACGPSLLRNGCMSTELILPHGNGRVRVVYQHAPVWEAGIEPGSCPPQGLKLFRIMVSRETLNTSGPPTRESEEEKRYLGEEKRGDPVFFRGVPPFAWHKKWAGTSWTCE